MTDGIRRAVLLALCGVVLLVPGRNNLTTFHEVNTAGRVYAVQALVDYGAWHFEDILCRTGPGHSIVDMSVRDGLPYLQKAPGVSWLGVPAYAALSAASGGGRLPFHWTANWLAALCVALPSLLVAGTLWGRLRAEYGPRAASVAVAALLLASPLFIHCAMFHDYGLAPMLLVAGAMALWRGDSRGLAGGGLLLGIAAATSYPFAAYGALVVVLELLRRHRREEAPARALGLIALGAALPVCALLVYHTVVWGSPLRTGYAFLSDPGQVARHAAIGASVDAPLSMLWRSMVGPKHGIFMAAPWAAVGLAGLVGLARDPARRFAGLTGLAVVAATLAVSAIYTASNDDTLAFGRHVTAAFPWFAWGLAHALHRAASTSGALRGLIGGATAAGLAVGALYAFSTGWTFPYHSDVLESPLWQINVPLFMNGVYLPVWSPFDSSAIPGAEAMAATWPWVAVTAACAVGAFLTGAARGQAPARRSHWSAPASFIAVLALLLAWGAGTAPAAGLTGPEIDALLQRARRGEALPPETAELLRSVRRERRHYASAGNDITGSYFTPQDASWRDSGYPEARTPTNWCSVALGVASAPRP